jgi:hypothetical protein
MPEDNSGTGATLAVALLSAASAHADQAVLTYHGGLDRAGRYVVPGLTYDRARGLRLDSSFHAAFGARSMRSRCFGVGWDRARAS